MFLGEIFGVDGIIVVVVVAVVLFGGAALPKFAKNLGLTKSEFEKGMKEGKAQIKDAETKPADAETKTPDTNA